VIRPDVDFQRRLGLFKTAQATVATGSLYLVHKLGLWDGAWWWSVFFLAFAAYHISEVMALEWSSNKP